MGVYIDSTDIESEFRKIDFTAADSNITTAEVDEFIDQVEKYVESRISCVYVTPITATASVAIVKTICTYLVKDRVAKILTIKTNKSVDQSESESLREIEEEMLTAICDSELNLVGSTLVESNNGVGSWSASNTTTFSRKFKRDTDAW